MKPYTLKKKNITQKVYPIWFVYVSAILTMISLTFFKLNFLVWGSQIFIILYFMSNELTAKKAFKAFLIYGLLFNFTFLHWLFNLHPLTWMGYTMAESFILTFLAWFSLSIFESLFYAVIGFFAFLFKPSKTIIKGFLVVLVIMLVEWSRGVALLGFPWARLALSQYMNTNIIKSASLFGILFVSFIILSINFFLACSAYMFTARKMGKTMIFLCMALFVFSANYIFGAIDNRKENVSISKLNVSIVQGNVAVDDKWGRTENESVKDKHFRLTKEVVARYPGTDYIFWAESAIPTNLTNHPELLSEISALSKEINTPLIIGAILYDENGGLRNSIIYVDAKGIEGKYYKRHPVPLGEYIPFKNLVFAVFPKAKDSKIASEGLVAGKDSNLINIDGYKLGCLVCYDSIFPDLSRDAARDGSNLLFVASNDSWYKKSNALEQHNAQSVFRAVETNKYLIRAANTGISSIISPQGELIAVSNANREEILNANVFLNEAPTLYTKIGDLFMYILLFVFVLVLFSPLVDKNHIGGKKSISIYNTKFMK